jgi:pimeloyl-ACP methyl ester carboxylesterase
MRPPAAGPLRSEIVTTWLNASFEMRFRLIGGLTVRFAASGDHADQALLLSPWPESLLAFEPLWPRLAERTRLVAVDLPGFGHSQRSDALLSPRAMGEFIIAVADAFGLRHPHVVAPGTGTPAALFAAARHPGRLRSLVAGSSAAAVPLQVGGMVKDVIEAPNLDGFRHADPRPLLTTGPGGLRRQALPEAVRDDYLACYQGDRFAQSLRYLRSYPAELPVLAGLLPRIGTPVRLIAGAGDEVTPPANATFLHERLPHSKLDVIDAGHFTWEDASAEYAALVTSWWHGSANEARE